MKDHLVKLSEILSNHKNFLLDCDELKLYYKEDYNTDYNRIRDIVSLTEELITAGIDHEVHDEYIQTHYNTQLTSV